MSNKVANEEPTRLLLLLIDKVRQGGCACHRIHHTVETTYIPGQQHLCANLVPNILLTFCPRHVSSSSTPLQGAGNNGVLLVGLGRIQCTQQDPDFTDFSQGWAGLGWIPPMQRKFVRPLFWWKVAAVLAVMHLQRLSHHPWRV